MEKEIFYEYQGSSYGDGILLDEYRNEFSLVVAKRKDGKTYKEWVFPQKRDGSKQPLDKSLPWKIKLGSKDEALRVLRFFLAELEGTPASPHKNSARRDHVPIGEPPPEIPYDDEPPF